LAGRRGRAPLNRLGFERPLATAAQCCQNSNHRNQRNARWVISPAMAVLYSASPH
jgi:hypothetical protein